MEIIAVESQAYQELIDRLNRIEQYVERTSHLIQDIDDELEMTTKDLIGTLNVSESTLIAGARNSWYGIATRRVAMYATSSSLS